MYIVAFGCEMYLTEETARKVKAYEAMTKGETVTLEDAFWGWSFAEQFED